eukprot:gnl/TRDRNA2_/TRDRNA2_85975_c0_seq1.p1 gnl/TRDRNA2_/TRDRNA2_85975_c0~~gnl/TRDRNA2_/TRDRNA2_85975_c0_seq1.p1  ORF type:complete len:472 (-),score=53.90 gnl/TRDRNA2_/TRDRNA2_85975_c0_seq1:118-1533(-)
MPGMSRSASAAGDVGSTVRAVRVSGPPQKVWRRIPTSTGSRRDGPPSSGLVSRENSISLYSDATSSDIGRIWTPMGNLGQRRGKGEHSPGPRPGIFDPIAATRPRSPSPNNGDADRRQVVPPWVAQCSKADDESTEGKRVAWHSFNQHQATDIGRSFKKGMGGCSPRTPAAQGALPEEKFMESMHRGDVGNDIDATFKKALGQYAPSQAACRPLSQLPMCDIGHRIDVVNCQAQQQWPPEGKSKRHEVAHRFEPTNGQTRRQTPRASPRNQGSMPYSRSIPALAEHLAQSEEPLKCMPNGQAQDRHQVSRAVSMKDISRGELEVELERRMSSKVHRRQSGPRPGDILADIRKSQSPSLVSTYAASQTSRSEACSEDVFEIASLVDQVARSDAHRSGFQRAKTSPRSDTLAQAVELRLSSTQEPYGSRSSSKNSLAIAADNASCRSGASESGRSTPYVRPSSPRSARRRLGW